MMLLQPTAWAVIAAILAVISLQPQPAQEPATQPGPGKPAPSPSRAPNPATIAVDRKDEGWVARNNAFNARARQGAEKGDINIIFLGDSITQGWEGAGKEAWERRIAKRGAVNFGIGGDRTQHVLWRLEHGNVDGLAAPKSGRAPALVVLMIGTNNSADDSAEQIAEGVGAVVNKLQEKLPATKVLLLGVFPRSENPDPSRSKILSVNRMIRTLADGKSVIYFDLGNRFLEIDGTISRDVMPDALHLSPMGYDIWVEAIHAKLDEMAPAH
jgi:lysophospholipase L1-like esterase